MGAIILDGAVINRNTLVAAGAVVREGTKIPEGVLVAGVPARVVRELDAGEIAGIEKSANNYVHYVNTYKERE